MDPIREHRELLKGAFAEITRELLINPYEMNLIKQFRFRLKEVIEEESDSSSDTWSADEKAFALIGIYFNVLLHWLSDDTQSVDDLQKNFERQLDLLWEGL
ncbi:hypothetical protein [Caldalkalibacillus mannanilyticus]|uniref:hypothetical protein n=1 Tax=Caldalkalibacillus mannanilyticus TaxID=1418 RepID=UPI0006872FA3|nr:hypothetical protein [Caldalkalibacillus mannanilyticus]